MWELSEKDISSSLRVSFMAKCMAIYSVSQRTLNFWKCFIEWQNVVRLRPCCAAPDVEVNPPDLVTPLLRNPSVCGLSYISWVSPANGAQITESRLELHVKRETFSFSLTVFIIFLLHSYCSTMCLKGLNVTWICVLDDYVTTIEYDLFNMTFFGNIPDKYLICLNSHIGISVIFNLTFIVHYKESIEMNKLMH